MSLTLQIGGDQLTISARQGNLPGQMVVNVGEREFLVGATRTGDGALQITFEDGRTLRAAVSREGATHWVSCGGRNQRFDEAVAGASPSPVDHDLEAPMPGKVLTVECRAGQAVKRGDVLMIVEAMKMEHAIKAPYDGVVVEFRASQGQLVSPGEPLVELEAT